MPPAGFELATPASDRPQSIALDRSSTGRFRSPPRPAHSRSLYRLPRKWTPTAHGVPRRSPVQVLTCPTLLKCGERRRICIFNVLWPLARHKLYYIVILYVFVWLNSDLSVWEGVMRRICGANREDVTRELYFLQTLIQRPNHGE